MADTQLTDAQRILELKYYLRASYKDIADVVGVTEGYFTNIRSNRNKISAKLAQKIVAQYPNISYDWLMTGEGNMTTDAPTINANGAPVQVANGNHNKQSINDTSEQYNNIITKIDALQGDITSLRSIVEEKDKQIAWLQSMVERLSSK